MSGLIDLGLGNGSKAEKLKVESDYLRGGIARELAAETARFSEEDLNLLKFHGSYQQDDRDLRRARKAEGLDKAYSFMVRSAIPGGAMTAEQYLAMDSIGGEIANGTLRVTTRQGIQFHGILKGDLRAGIRRINEALLTTISACGDVSRNVMACPAPATTRAHARIQEVAAAIARHLAPHTRAYHEIWIEGEKAVTIGDDVEPIYGKSYLPRKFKVAVAYPGDNCVDVYTQDVGLVAEVDGEMLKGFTVLVGGGLGMTHNKPDTYPCVAQPLGFIAPEDVLGVVEAIVTLQRDYGDRENRKHARMKYLVAERGIVWFRQQVEARIGRPLADPHPVAFRAVDDHLGWNEQGDGAWSYGVHVENGRIKDEGTFRLRSALREIATTIRPNVRLTAQHNVILTDVPAKSRDAVTATLRRCGVATDLAEVGLHRLAMACPALPTCGQAVAESERVLPALVDAFAAELARAGLAGESVSIRMTGCPNGCARPYMGDVGLVGRSADLYDIFVGGDLANTRLNFLLKSGVKSEALVPTLAPVFAFWRDGRTAGEAFGDFCARIGRDGLLARAEAAAA